MRIRTTAAFTTIFCSLVVTLVSVSWSVAQTPSPPGSGQAAPNSQAPGSQFPPAGGQQPGQPGQPAPGQAGTRPPGSTLPTGGGEDQLFMELKFSYNYAQINDSLGPDGRPANSFLTPGNNVTTDLTYFQDHSWNSGRVQVLGIVRNTNDIRVDPEQNSFQRGYF